MHVCYLCSEYPPAPHGGIGSFTQTMAHALVERGHYVSVVGAYPPRYAGAEVDEGARIVRLSRAGPLLLRFPLNRIRLARELRRIDRARPIDIIEGGELEMCAIHRSAPGVKLVRMHGGPNFFALDGRPGVVRDLKERWAYHVADHLCAVSHSVAEGRGG